MTKDMSIILISRYQIHIKKTKNKKKQGKIDNC